MFAFINFQASCYIDAVLVALFLPSYNSYFNTMFFGPLSPSNGLTLALFNEMEHLKIASTGWKCQMFRRELMLSSSDFSNNSPHSAVDFLRHLFGSCAIRDTLSTFQTSTTLIRRREETVDIKDDLRELVNVWMVTPISHKWNHMNAETLTDEADVSERTMLLRDATQTSFLLQNIHGDRRRINPPETSSIFLCQLSTDDDDVTKRVMISRQLLPHLESTGDDYEGQVLVKINATRLLSCPVLIIEVARLVTFFDARKRRVVQQKQNATVDYGVFDSVLREWVLNIFGKYYRLVAVVCHLGANTSNGHYVTFVENSDLQWYFYDDRTPSGKLLPVHAESLESSDTLPHPSTTGELFFYVPCNV